MDKKEILIKKNEYILNGLYDKLRYNILIYRYIAFNSYVFDKNYYDLCDIYCIDDVRLCLRILKNESSQRCRLYKRIKYMFDHYDDIYFLTITLNDTYINYNLDTLKKYLKRALKNSYLIYICNIDYGSNSSRLHFHALVSGKIQDFIWSYGFINEKVVNVKNEKNLASYILKFKNHALKDTTRSNKVIYSRGFKC